MVKQCKITLIWDSRHQYINGSKLSRKATIIEILQEKYAIGLTKATCKLFSRIKMEKLIQLLVCQTYMVMSQSLTQEDETWRQI